ncbi:MAG TPA: polysaccharide deacetylase family protein [Pirellulales bacterium]|jgi:peptidoglycan/xylan/chitin deacetylase (PgdA/CDA1 family)|nr:polysaccharide deacetylase family protein [Pirellulales bacterium]
MPWWKQALLNLYYQASRPYRYCWRRSLASRGRLPVVVLFYHRVADRELNEWTCPRAMFRRQMLWLKEHARFVSLAEAQRRIRSGQNPQLCVSITFDDGYADNCEFAIPLLKELDIPCTYFVSSGYVGKQTPFPHDAKVGQKLEPNTAAQLREMVAAGIEIGAHTRTHADLGRITDPARMRDEIAGSRTELENLLGSRVRYFAFPYGLHANMNQLAFRTAREVGYEAACSAYGAYNFPGGDGFHIQRVHGDSEMARLRNWVSLDPRKLRTVPFIDDGRSETPPACASADPTLDGREAQASH